MAKGSYIGQVQIGNDTFPVGSILYGTCGAAANASEKIVNDNNLTTATFNDNNLTTGVTIHIKFANSNTADNPTLTIGNATTKPIKIYGTTAPGSIASNSWVAGAIVSFTYDGTNWVMNTGVDSNDTYIAATSTPNAVSTAGAVGTSTKYAREDHIHAISVTQGTNSGELVIGGTTITPKNIAAAAFKEVDTSLAADTISTNLPTSAAVAGLINSVLATNDAMVFKGTLGTNGTITAVPTNNYVVGETYKIITAGTYAGNVCEVGDMLIAINNGPTSGSSVVNTDWTVVQTNIDGAVTGPASSTDGAIPLFDGTSGKIIKNSGYSPNSFASSDHTQAVDKGGTNITGYSIGDIIYASAAAVLSKLAIGAENKILASTGSAPSWKTVSVSATPNVAGDIVSDVGALTGGVLPTFTQGTKASASVSNGTLTLVSQGTDTFTQGTLPSLGTISKANIAVSLS